MRLLLLCAALALTSTPAAAQEPNDYTAGVAARQAGNAREAARLLRSWLAAHPSDLDAQLQLAYAELDLGNLDAAERGFTAVVAAAPSYQDARAGLEAVARRRAGTVLEPSGFVLLEGAISDLGGNARNWTEIAIEAEGAAGPATRIGGRASYYRRFGLTDVELTARATYRASDRVWVRAVAGGTPGAEFRPRWQVGGGADWRIAAGGSTVLTIDAQFQRFPVQDVVTLNPGVVQYLADGKAWVTLRGIGTVADGGPLQVGALVRGDYTAGERTRVFGGVSNGPDTDLGVVTRVTGLFGGVEFPVGERLGAVTSIAREWRDGGADRTEFRIGLKVAM